jgi:hypothetical protein
VSVVKIRQSQIVSTYGPGALVDLPDYAIIVAGLEHWTGQPQLVHEPRLLANLRTRLELPALELRSPPVPARDDQYSIGILGWQFPEWFVAQYEVRSKELGRARPMIHRRGLVHGRYRSDDGKKWPVVPIRFVQGCPNGHISDIDWPSLLHGAGVACGGQLWLAERGTTGDIVDLFLHCDGCNHPSVQLIRLQGSKTEESLLGSCSGARPWIGPAAQEACAAPEGGPHRNRLLIRHASNAYFPVTERAISIPDQSERVRKAVDAVWEMLTAAESVAELKLLRKVQRVQQALEGFSNDEVWTECTRRREGSEVVDKTLKQVELEAFLAVPDELGEDVPDGDFYARRLALPGSSTGAVSFVERIVLVHRLREVVVEVGFTRFEAPALPIESEVDLGVRLASLAMEPKWLPAVENRGEGIFLSLDPDAVGEWLRKPAVRARAEQFHGGIQTAWKKPLPPEHVLNVHMPYVLLHSLSHLLLTAVALECGYAAASIRERIYVQEGAYGLLLYTGTSDAEGTLGGLVQMGRRIASHLKNALELGRLCSNAPVCAQHRPDQPHEGRFLHGAACHGCLLIAEPSCERRNELLDRSLVVGTVDDEESAFFPESMRS